MTSYSRRCCTGETRGKRGERREREERDGRTEGRREGRTGRAPPSPRSHLPLNLSPPAPPRPLLPSLPIRYVAANARANPDLTLLTINLLTKDCAAPDPTVRGLALRALGGLRLPGLVEYLAAPLTAALGDPHPYVRRVASLVVSRVLATDAGAVARAGWLPRLTASLGTEPDPAVLAATLAVLRGAGALPPASRALVIPLLNRLRDFSEWGQCLVMDVATGFAPRDEAEAYALMNALDDRLASTNSALVLGAAKLFLHLTLGAPATHQAVLDRLLPPLLTLVGGDCPATAYAALAHLRLLAERAPSVCVAGGCVPALHVRASDPPPVRAVKVATLATLADEATAHDIASELVAYAADPDPAFARAAVAALGSVAAAVPGADGVPDRLFTLLDPSVRAPAHPGVLAEAIVQAAALARRVPGAGPAALGALASLSPSDIADPAGRAAFVWLLGEAGGDVPDAPYLLEPLAAAWASQPRAVRLALLRSAGRLFAVRPAEAHPALGAALAAGTADPDADVRDRAALYGRLLAASPAGAAAFFSSSSPPPPPGGAGFEEGPTPEARDAIFAEFNSLSVLYRAPAASFVDEGGPGGAGAGAGEDDDDEGGGGGGPVGGATPAPAAQEDSLLGDFGAAVETGGGGGGAAASSADALAELMGGGSGEAAPPPPPQPYLPSGGDGGLTDLLGAATPQPAQPAAPAPAASDDLLGGF